MATTEDLNKVQQVNQKHESPWYKSKLLIFVLVIIGFIAIASSSGGGNNQVNGQDFKQNVQNLQSEQHEQSGQRELVKQQPAGNLGQPNSLSALSKLAEPARQTEPVKPTETSKQVESADSNLSNNNYYVNSQNVQVHSPAFSDTVPAGASAQCRDGSYSFSQSRKGTCSRHGGVARWL